MPASTSAPSAFSGRSSTCAASFAGSEPMIERFLIILTLAAIAVVTVLAVRAWSGRRVEGLKVGQVRGLWNALGESPDGRPSLVVFSTPSCTACRTAQHPAVEAVEPRRGDTLRVLTVDLARRAAVRQALNVLTAPTPVLLRRDRRAGYRDDG